MSRYDADDVYCFPGTAVLKNKAGMSQSKKSRLQADGFLSGASVNRPRPFQG